ncbi:MarR family winged helix-turn-helix transcriptional regulator [Zafaria sp. Z1313]|uniref:MarR family winged helix-turn-helix transcriptional regulator n=1 Tax=unclassified Zafaria TaxID=2828765 RepID=UPI002E79A690|nr:MarR family transcriptional regulator [Zafaria sp. J156]MEE1622283.1 MarR family transcriptional regulator [Zafaria sp. J156]
MALNTETALKLVESIQSFHQVLKCVSHAGLRPGQPGLGPLAVLERIERSEPARAVDVAKGLGIGPAALSRHVAELESSALVLRGPDPDDARAQLLRLSDAGRDAVAAARDRRVEVLVRLLDGWDEARALDATGLLDDLALHLRDGLRTSREEQA